jgi:hypothetical protein
MEVSLFNLAVALDQVPSSPIRMASSMSPSTTSVVPPPSLLLCSLRLMLRLVPDFLGSSSEGRVFVIGSDGQIQSQITVGGPEITGLAIK